jgi:hypothetical protein
VLGLGAVTPPAPGAVGADVRRMTPSIPSAPSIPRSLKELERDGIVAALRATGGNKAQAAAILEIDRRRSRTTGSRAEQACGCAAATSPGVPDCNFSCCTQRGVSTRARSRAPIRDQRHTVGELC